MDKSSILKTFNAHFEEFLNDILRVFPDNNDVVTCREALLNMRKMNPKLMIGVFGANIVGPYRKEIQNNEIAFFIEKNYNNDISPNNASSTLSKIDIIRDQVREMSDVEKMSVIKYLNNLLKLCDLYNK